MKNDATLPRVACGALLSLCLLLVACRKDPRGPQWDVDLLAPLVKSSFTIRDIIADSLLVDGGDGSLTLLYRDELFALSLDTILQAPDTSFAYSFAIPIAGPVSFPPGAEFYNEEDFSRFDLGDVRLRELVVRSGMLDLLITNMVASNVVGRFGLPGATFQGGPVLIERLVGPGTPQTPTVVLESRPLDQHIFDLRGPEFDDFNVLSTSVTATLDPEGDGAALTDQDSVIAIASYRDLVPAYARGYFGDREVEVGPEDSRLELFDDLIAGILDLEAVTMRLKVTNGVGVDAQIFIRELRSVNTRTGNAVDLEHAITNGPINLDRALDLGNGFSPALYERTLDGGNSNIMAFVENLPDVIHYEADLRLNPLGDISNGNDFLYYESDLRAQLELEIPLRLIATDLTLQTFVAPELPGSAEAHGLQSGSIRLFAENGFPFSAAVQLAIVDQDDAVLTEIPVEGMVPAGIVDGEGLVTASAQGQLLASLDPAQMDLLYAGGRFRIRTVFNTADQGQHLPIMEHYRFDLRITAAANYIVNGDD